MKDTVLLVDDEVQLVSFLTRLVTGWNYRVLSATDGPTAVEFFRENRERIGLVLLDILMPEMGGAEVFRLIRAMDPSARVIITSAYAERETIGQLLCEGANSFMAKPYRIEELRREIDKVFEHA